jgi:hypothetical protein
MSSTRASPMMRSPYWRESFAPWTSSTRRGGDHLGAASSAATPPTSLPTKPRGKSSTPPTSTTTSTEMTPATRAMIRRCPECVLPSTTSTSLVITPSAQKRMRSSSASKATSSAFASWANLQGTSSTLTLMQVMIYPPRVFL